MRNMIHHLPVFYLVIMLHATSDRPQMRDDLGDSFSAM